MKRLMSKGVYGVEMMTTLIHKVHSSFRVKGREVRGTCIVIESQGYWSGIPSAQTYNVMGTVFTQKNWPWKDGRINIGY